MTVHLTSRALIRVDGEEAGHFLQNLITCDVDGLQSGTSAFGALLTPQGKILFDFLIHRMDNAFLIDVSDSQAADLAKRLTFYRLRAKVGIDRLPDPVHAIWPNIDKGFVDPRDARLGSRILQTTEPSESEAEWDIHRISLGFPECGKDFQPGEIFPHEALMDHFGHSGVDFSKGCYVGQEVVSRMQHRGTARSRFVKISTPDGNNLPAAGTEVKASDRTIGRMGSHSGANGLALLRLDRTATAMREGQAITVDGYVVEPTLPDFANFDWPQ